MEITVGELESGVILEHITANGERYQYKVPTIGGGGPSARVPEVEINVFYAGGGGKENETD